jgi:acyl-CoA reductase-like NAD-dependent aldehyde dehydrogenase
MLDITRPPFVFPCLVAGEPLDRSPWIEVRYPFTGEVIGSVPSLGVDDVTSSIRRAAASRCERSYRTEATPFGGIEDSGIGVNEGVVEAMKAMTYTKLYSLPWE